MKSKKNHIDQELKHANIKTSVGLWDAFEQWMAVQGYQTLSEGLRAAMTKVTNFDGQSQAQNTPT